MIKMMSTMTMTMTMRMESFKIREAPLPIQGGGEGHQKVTISRFLRGRLPLRACETNVLVKLMPPLKIVRRVIVEHYFMSLGMSHQRSLAKHKGRQEVKKQDETEKDKARYRSYLGSITPPHPLTHPSSNKTSIQPLFGSHCGLECLSQSPS